MPTFMNGENMVGQSLPSTNIPHTTANSKRNSVMSNMNEDKKSNAEMGRPYE